MLRLLFLIVICLIRQPESPKFKRKNKTRGTVWDYRIGGQMNENGFTLMELIIAAGILLVVAALGGFFYVVVHFVGKLW